MSKTVDAVKEIIEPISEKLGYEIVDIEYAKKFDGMNLTIYIYKKGGVSLEDCEAFHRAIDEPLDALDPSDNTPYILNVSSPGLDRPIKTDADLNRNLGEKIGISLYAPVEKKKNFCGILTAFDASFITIEADKTYTIERKMIAAIKPHIEF